MTFVDFLSDREFKRFRVMFSLMTIRSDSEIYNNDVHLTRIHMVTKDLCRIKRLIILHYIVNRNGIYLLNMLQGLCRRLLRKDPFVMDSSSPRTKTCLFP